jgi:vacuolar protein sorting-associated protein 13A/C
MDPKIWFQYAAKAVRHDIHKRKYKWTWSFFRKRRNDRLAYINLYTALRLEMIEAEEIEVLKHLELELSFDDIR